MPLQSGEDGLRLDPREWASDWDDPVGGVKGQWLPSYEPSFSEELRTWVTAQRETVHGTIRPRIIRELQTARASGDLTTAGLYAEQLLIIDELNEEATLTRAELLVMQGAKVDALRLLDSYEREVGKLQGGREASLPAQLLRRRIAEKLPAVSYLGANRHHGALVGRAAEFKALMGGIFEMRAGRGGGFVIAGPEGSGKSRILHEIYSAALMQHVYALRFAFSNVPELRDHAGLRLLIAHLLRLPGALGVDPLAYQRLQAWSAGQEAGPDECPLLEIEDLVTAIAEEKPLLLLLDGAEHIDVESLQRLDALYRIGAVRHHMLVLTLTTPSKVSHAAQTPALQTVGLAPLTMHDVREIIAAFAADEKPTASADLISCAAVFSEGVPMYGIEMLGLLLDHGSPDTIPWRVEVAAERGSALLSDLERRLLVLCEHLKHFATTQNLQASLRCTDEHFRLAMTRLEACHYLHFFDGHARASAILASASTARVSPHDLREDASRAAELLGNLLEETGRPDLFFITLRLMLEARQDTDAENLLDRHAGALLRSDTAPSLTFELARIRDMVRSRSLRQMIDGLVRHISASAQSVKSDTRNCASRILPSSLPFVSPVSHELEHRASSALLPSALQAARDPSLPIGHRVTEAVIALAIASDSGDQKALLAANKALNGVRHYAGSNPFDVHRGDLIFAASSGNRNDALQSAGLLATACREINDIQLACKGMRNAAQVLATFGEMDSAQALLLESRELADRLGYMKQVAWVDIRLADLAIENMDLEGARSYVTSASTITRSNQIETPMLLLDLEVQRCWTSILDGDISQAGKAARSASRQSKRADVGSGTALWTLLAVKLATHTGGISEDVRSGFSVLRSSIGSRVFYPNEHFSLAGLLLSAHANKAKEETRGLAEGQLAAHVRFGRKPWPFIVQLLSLTAAER